MGVQSGVSTATATGAASSVDDTRLRGRWLLFARTAWIATALFILVMNAIATPIAFHLLQTVCVPGQCVQQINPNLNQFTPAQAGYLRRVGISLGSYAAFVMAWQWLGTLIYTGVAAVVFWRRSSDRIALLAAFALVTFVAATGNGPTGVLPRSNPAWTVPVTVIGLAGQITFYVFFCLFPSGRFVPRWLRWPALLYAVAWLLTLLPVAPLNALVTGPTVPFFAGIGILVFGQVWRYRRASTPVERQQTKWVVFGFALGVGGVLGLFALLGFVNLVLGAPDPNNGVSYIFAGAAFALLIDLLLLLVPTSIVIAILRSGLWDIDLIINRTLVYGSLTALLAAVYFSSVFGMQHVASALAGPQASANPLISVVSTLLIVVLFSPLRTRVQQVIDRRFYRAKYDSARTLERFAVTLRSEVDLEHLRTHLLGVVQETMQPAHVSLWLRAPERRRDM